MNRPDLPNETHHTAASPAANSKTLLVLETGLSAHNDVFMLFYVVLAVWLHLRGWKTAAVFALILSAFVKFLTAMLVPLYLLLVLRAMS